MTSIRIGTCKIGLSEFDMNTQNYLVILDASRHGQTTSNLTPGYMGGIESEVDMTEEGIQQIEALGSRYKTANIKPHQIYTSTIKRAVVSGQLLAKKIGFDENAIHSTLDLDEIDMGSWAGRLRSEVLVGDALKDMERLGKDFNGHGGESHNDVTKRVQRFLDSCLENAMRTDNPIPLHIVALTHVTTMRCILNAIGAIGHIQSPDVAIYNGRTMRICFNRNTHRWELHGFNLTDLALDS